MRVVVIVKYNQVTTATYRPQLANIDAEITLKPAHNNVNLIELNLKMVQTNAIQTVN